MKKGIFLLFFLQTSIFVGAQVPELPADSIFFVKNANGWDLYIKKITGIGSILLTESQRDPAFKVTAYSLRALTTQSVNAGEKRILDGKPIKSRDASVFLIDSTPEKIGALGEFYHFFLTNEVVYGYPWAREGRLSVAPGVRINARLFEKKYGDYSGRFRDQWITLTPRDLPLEKAKAESKKPMAETTIVLLHSSNPDIALSPSPAPRSSPSLIDEQKETLIKAVEKIAGRAGLQQAARYSYGYLSVERLSAFPFEKVKDPRLWENARPEAGEERVFCRFLFADGDVGTAAPTGFSTFHLDERGRIIRINEYGPDRLLSRVFLIEYGNGEEPLRIIPYDGGGKALPER